MSHTDSDQAAVSAAWGALSERLRGFALSLTRDPDAAADLTQQTLMRLLARAPEKVDHVGYARQTMTRLWLDRQRAARRRIARLARWSLTAPRWDRDGDAVEMDETQRRLQAQIDALPPRQRAALVLRLVEELDYPAIADAMGCDVNAVRSLLHLARRRVRQGMGGE